MTAKVFDEIVGPVAAIRSGASDDGLVQDFVGWAVLRRYLDRPVAFRDETVKPGCEFMRAPMRSAAKRDIAQL
jgi:hypothetical protein